MNNKVFRFLTSVRLAIILMAALAVLCALATLIPQNQEEQIYVQQFGEGGAKIIFTLGFHHILSSVWMYLAAIAFGINLGLCTFSRIYWAVRSAKKQFKLSLLGSPILHIGLCFVLIGAAFSFLFAKQLYYEIPVGETTSIQGAHGAFSLTVDDFGIEYYDDEVTPSQYTSNILLQGADGTQRRETVQVNAPVKYDGITILQQDYGWEASVSIFAGQGSVKRTIKGEEWIPIGGEGEQAVSLGIAFYPDYAEENGVPQWRSDRDRNPRLIWVLSRGGVPIKSQNIGLHETALIQEPLRVSFDSYRYYTGLQTKYDPGIPVIFGGFFLVCLGLVLKYLIITKTEPKKDGEDDSNIVG